MLRCERTTFFSRRLPQTGVKQGPGPLFSGLSANTPTAEGPRRIRVITDVFAGFERLLAEPKEPCIAGDARRATASAI